MPGTSIATTLNSAAQDTVVDLANATYSGGSVTRVRTVTSGEFAGYLVVHATNKAGVIVDLAPPDSLLPDGSTNTPNGQSVLQAQSNQRGNYDGNGGLTFQSTQRLILVGFHFRNGTTWLKQCRDMVLMYCTFHFGMDPWWYYGWDKQHPSGDAGPLAPNGKPYGYNAAGGRAGGPRPCNLRAQNRNIRLYGCDIQYGGSGFSIGNGDQNILFDGSRTLHIGAHAGIPALGTIGDPDDILHDDAVGITTGSLSVQFNNCDFGVAQSGETASNARIQCISSPRPSLNPTSHGGPVDIRMDNCWLKGASGPGLNYGSVFLESPVTGLLNDLYVWNYGGVARSEMYETWGHYDNNPPYNDHPQYINVPMQNVTFAAPSAPVTSSPAMLRRAEHPYADYLDWLEEDGVYTPSAPTPPALPTAPTSLVASVVDSSRINLTWEIGTGVIETTHVERSLNGSTWTEITGIPLAGTVEEYAAVGLAASTLYYFRVRHKNSAGYSPYSSSVSKTTNAAAPPATGSQVPSIRGVSTKIGFGGLSYASMTKPSGTATGNFMLMMITTSASTSGPMTLTEDGFTLIGEYTAGGTMMVHLSYKFALADEPTGWTIPFNDPANYGLGGILSLGNVHASDPVDVVAVTQYTSATAAYVAPSATPDGDYGLHVVCYAADDGGITFTTPTGMDERWDLGVNTSVGCALFTTPLAAAGATGTKSSTASASQEGVAISLVIRSADSGVFVPPPPTPPGEHRRSPFNRIGILL